MSSPCSLIILCCSSVHSLHVTDHNLYYWISFLVLKIGENNSLFLIFQSSEKKVMIECWIYESKESIGRNGRLVTGRLLGREAGRLYFIKVHFLDRSLTLNLAVDRYTNVHLIDSFSFISWLVAKDKQLYKWWKCIQ